MNEGDGLLGRGGALGAVVETGGSGETAEGRVRRYFCIVKGVAAMVI